ncbi:MAG: hypothetical protein RML72_01580 [Bacteroidia bacterium]|nr:hypothetical protein [Bacteroidia bacterium]MDW8157550.1 hypothetical protein [Bacteroidia bacterium]
MNPIQIHLVTNHIAIVGYIFIILIGCLAIIFRVVQYRYLVYGLTLVCSVVGGLSYFSGQKAMEQKYQMVLDNTDLRENIINLKTNSYLRQEECFSRIALEKHEAMAEIALIFFSMDLILAFIGIVSCLKWPMLEKFLFGILLLLLSISTFWIIQMAHEGGKINHSALR